MAVGGVLGVTALVSYLDGADRKKRELALIGHAKSSRLKALLEVERLDVPARKADRVEAVQEYFVVDEELVGELFTATDLRRVLNDEGFHARGNKTDLVEDVLTVFLGEVE